MAVLQHEHSLSLVDLNPTYPYDEQVYDDEEYLIIKQAFQIPCNRCHKKLTYFHRYYYKCDQCDYMSHKLCAELPTRLEHASHISHTLTIFLDESQWQCYMCESVPRFNQVCYHCSHCSFNICLDCGMNRVQYHSIYHSSHKHPLIPLYRHKEILAECEACGKEHKGIFYHCVTCFHCFIHKDCVFQPKRLLIQDGTRGQFFHTHQLIITYSFPKIEQKARFDPPCMICDNSFSNYKNRWVYKCDKCIYYVHLHCASLRREPAKSGMDDITSKYATDPVVHLPLPDRTCNIIKDFLIKETNETSITHDSHQHPLALVDTQCNDITTFSMNKVEDICNGCARPIFLDMPFYKCTYGCKFVLHDWCTRLPAEFKDLCGTRQTLVLFPKSPSRSPGLFRCRNCSNYCRGFAYSSYKDKYICLDSNCALTPTKITHPSHPHHQLEKHWSRPFKNYCRMCFSAFGDYDRSYSCRACNFHLHLGCAMFLTTTIRHKYDKHPMTLSYRPIDDHEGDYFCEVCEEELNPHISFYHCRECDQSMHTACAPLIIPQNIIQNTNVSVHKTMKYGGIYKTKDHHHPLSFLIPAEGDVDCAKCSFIIRKYTLRLKCLQCEFAIHSDCSSDLKKAPDVW